MQCGTSIDRRVPENFRMVAKGCTKENYMISSWSYTYFSNPIGNSERKNGGYWLERSVVIPLGFIPNRRSLL